MTEQEKKKKKKNFNMMFVSEEIIIWNKSSSGLFFMKWHQVAFILLFTSQFTVLINYVCILDTTLRVLNTWYRLHVICYISFWGVIVCVETSLHLSILDLSCLNCFHPGCWLWPFKSFLTLNNQYLTGLTF